MVEDQDMHEWEQYRDRYTQRVGTFEAYVEVWQRNRTAQQRFGGWSIFSRCASAEPAMQREQPERVALAEEVMRSEGYTIGPSTARGARTWVRRRSSNPG